MSSPAAFTFHPCEIAFCGLSGSGKTTLISRLTTLLRSRYSVGYYKHGCHRFDIDRKGKDSDVVRRAGAETVMISDPEKQALISSLPAGAFPATPSLLHLDILLVEGLKELPIPKVLLVDAGHKILDMLGSRAVTNVIALAASDPAAVGNKAGVPVFQRDDIESIASFVERFLRDRLEANALQGLVLAGGHSRRMGRDKALLTYHGENQLVRTANMLFKYCKQVYISCRVDQAAAYRGLGYPLVADSYLDLGPLGGLLSAQRLLPGNPWLVTACDLPFLRENLLETLVEQRNPFSFATAWKPEPAGKPEPLCTLYETKSRIPLLIRHAAGENSLRAFLEELPVHYLSLKETCTLENVNDPEARRRAKRQLSAQRRRSGP